MKRTNLKCRAMALLVFVFIACTHVYAQLDLGEIMAGVSDMNNWYYVNLTAKNSTTSGGSGKVRLMTIDMGGSRIYDQFMGVDIDDMTRMAGWPNGNPQPWASQMTQLGFSIVYMPGVEADLLGMNLSSYAYYAAWAKADDGSYFAGWSYTNGGTDLGLAGAESDWDKDDWTEEQWYAYCVENGLHSSGDHWVSTGPNDGYWEYNQIYKNDKLTGDFLYLKVLPDNNQGFIPNPDYTISGKTNRTLYATFRPVQVVDYKAYTGTVDASEGEVGYCGIDVKVAGRNIDDADFNNPVVAGAGWELDRKEENGNKGWTYDEELGVVVIDLTYTVQPGVEAGQEVKTTLTFSSKAGSTISVPVTMRVVAAGRSEATLKIGEVEQSGNWADMLAAANAATNQPVVLTLNKDIENLEATQVISNTMTFNPNGYVLQSSTVAPLTINGGVVTMAYSKYEGGVNGNGVTAIVVNAGELVLEGGYINGDVNVAAGAKLTQNGAWIDGTILNAGTTIVKDGTINPNNKDYAIRSTGGLTVDGAEMLAPTAIYVESGTANLKKGRINGTNVAVLSKGATTVEKLAELTSAAGTALVVNGGTTTINCGKFDAPTLFTRTAGTMNLVSGYFKSVEGLSVPAGKKVLDVAAGPEYRAGYVYFVGDEEAQQAAGVPVCTIGTTGYPSLEAALAYANNNKGEEVVIVLKNDYTLPAGYFTLPANAMLLIPFEDGQETGYELITRITKNSVTNVDYVVPFEYRRLTLAEGAHLDVFGTVEISGRQFASDEAYAAVPYAGYGLIQMNEGSSITMQGGSLMRAWGYMIGKGEMDVRRGATVREQFQMGDWKGGTTSMNMLSDWRHVFPLTQYFIQNIESPVKYHAGSVLSTATAVSAALGGLGLTATANDIKIVGIQGQDDAMFLMSMAADEENTWVRKWYDVENDIQTYEVYSSAHIGSMVLDLGKIGTQYMQMHSGWFNLPITNNMKIHLLYGYMDFTQSTELLPGAEVEIDKESTVAIVNTDGVVSGSLYIYDAEDWDAYAYDGSGSTMTKTVKYSPSWFAKNGTGIPTARNLNVVKDAQINVHGTFDTFDGHVFTSEHGANIFSSNEDAGTFKFTTAALGADYTEDVYQVRGRSDYQYKVFYPAQLKNAEGQTPTFATTAATEAGKSYCYINGRWTLMTVDPDDENFMVDNYGDYYAKPNAYVPVDATKTDGVFSGNDDHTFSGKYEQDRLFILTPDNQWWEVTVKDNLYYCADNDMYYEWDPFYYTDPAGGAWVEKKFAIHWVNWDGTPLKDEYNADMVYNVPYGTMAEFRSTNPEREANVDYTYDFTGWSPALGKVTTDVTYTATFTAKPRQYTIIFQTEGGAEIERQFLIRDEFPACENEPTKVGHILKWEPALAAVTGDATYTATWLEEKPATWNIRFVNYNGTPVGEADGYDVVAGTMPEAPATPVKPATSEFSYTFAGWKPALEEATRDLTYTAQFNEVAKTYAITFTDENNNPLGAVQNLTYGAAPVVPNYTKEPTAQYTYTIDWSPKVVAVGGNQTYKAVVTPTTNKYTVACVGEGCSFTGAGIYEYGATPTLSVSAQADYENAAWVNGPAAGFMVTGDVTFTAAATLKPAVEEAKTLVVDATSVVDLNNEDKQYISLTIKSNGMQSADLRGISHLTVTGAANYDLEQALAARTWYAVAVPWEVNADNGVMTLDGRKLVLGKDIDFMYYDGAERAANGKTDECWKYVEYDGDHTLRPGRLYMAYLANAQSGLRFQKKAGASLIYGGGVTVAQYTSGVPADANWNGIANPATYHATLATGATEGQFYTGSDYTMQTLATTEFIVGQPVFVQAPAAQSVVVNATSVAPAPMRVQAAETQRYDVQIAPENGAMADHIYVAAEDDKLDEYVIVKDLVKMGVSTKKAQLWVNRYDERLCVNTTELQNDMADFPLEIAVPQQGDYTLALAEGAVAGQSLYLLYNDVVIANLSVAPCTLSLTAGNTTEYALRIAPASAPSITTSQDDINAQDNARVVFMNNNLYILRNGKLYTTAGQLVY